MMANVMQSVTRKAQCSTSVTRYNEIFDFMFQKSWIFVRMKRKECVSCGKPCHGKQCRACFIKKGARPPQRKATRRYAAGR